MSLPTLPIFLMGFQALLLFSEVNSIDEFYFNNYNLKNICDEYKDWVTQICQNSSTDEQVQVTGGECKSMTMEFTTAAAQFHPSYEMVNIADCTDEDGDTVYCATTSADDTKFFVYDFIIHEAILGGGYCDGNPQVRNMPQEVVEAIREKRAAEERAAEERAAEERAAEERAAEERAAEERAEKERRRENSGFGRFFR